MLRLFLQQQLAQESKKLCPNGPGHSATTSPLSLTGIGIIGRLHKLAWRKHSSLALPRPWCWLGCSLLFDIAASLLPLLLPSTILLARSQLQLRLLPRFHKHKFLCASNQATYQIYSTHSPQRNLHLPIPTHTTQVQQRNRRLYHTGLPISTPKPWHPLSPSR